MANDKLHLFTILPRLLITYLPTLLLQRLQAIIHSLTYRSLPPSSLKTVLVLGGSFTGTALARRLRQTLPTGYRVVLIEKNSHFNYSFNFPRYAIVSGLEERAFIPYTNLASSAPKGIFAQVQGNVVSVDGVKKEVELENGEKVGFEFLAVATGSRQGFPAKVQATEKRDGVEEFREFQERVRGSGRIAVVGGGAVGVQLSADVKEWFPEKEVLLVHSRERLLSGFGERLGDYVAGRLGEMGVKLRLGERPSVGSGEKATTLKFKDGSEEVFDLMIPCTGQIPNSSIISSLGPDVLAKSGRINVKPTLQLSDPAYPHIFALGDVAETYGPKMGRAGMMQAEIVVSNILSMIKGGEASKKYVPHFVEGALKLSLGKSESVIYVKESPERDILVPGKSKCKNEDLGIAQVWKHFGADTKDYSV